MKVAIAGFGIEGQASFRYYSSLGADITIVDENENHENLPEGVPTILGEGAFQKLQGFDIVLRSPPISPARISTDGKIWSATNEFFAKCPAPIIGVTGTKGKGTTCSLIAEILKAAGKTVHLVGNIGVPALDELEKIQPDDIVVFELSSFQLWDLEKSPEAAVVLMIEADHLDVHSSMEEYISAKSNITLHQSNENLLIHHPTNEYSLQIVRESPAKKVAYMSPGGAEVQGDEIVIDNQPICTTNEVGLLGSHNLENICAAITASWNYTQDVLAIKQAVTSFKGLPHRLEFVREVGGVKYYDDSQATGVGSCLAALRSFSQSTVLILGGADKGTDIQEVIDELDEQRHCVVLIGKSSNGLAEKLHTRGFKAFVNLGCDVTMKQILQEANSHTKDGSVVLLSPAHASFDMFKNYQDRGDQFKQVVNEL